MVVRYLPTGSSAADPGWDAAMYRSKWDIIPNPSGQWIGGHVEA
jgi:hypothetical protein